MTKGVKGIYRVLQWLLMLLAYAFLAYKLLTYPDYATLLTHLHTAAPHQWGCLLFALLLLPLNLLLEARKWQTLLRSLCPISLREAFVQVLKGMQGAFVTPYRLGEHPARVVMLRDSACRKQAIALGFFGSAVLSLVIVLCGIVPSAYLLGQTVFRESNILWLTLALVLILLIGLIYLSREVTETLSRGYHLLGRVTFQSFLRYLVFSLQWVLMLRFVGICLTPQQILLAVPSYYLLVTLTPNMPAADVAIRGSWGIVALSPFTSLVPEIAIATVLIWLINTALPVLLCDFFIKMQSEFGESKI